MSNFCKSLVIVMAMAVATPAIAQQDTDVRYSNGKILLQQQRYEQAMAELLPLTSVGNTYAPEASYFYALAAFKAQKYTEAQNMLQQLKMQHPDWPQMPDATYLLANVLFERDNYDEAITQLQQLSSTPLASDAAALERHYLLRLTDKATFERLVQRHPNDKVLAQAYADKLVSGWYRPENKATLERLVSKHNLDRNKYLNAAARSQQGIDVALLLPFQLNQGQADRKNQFIYDLYAGMQLAQDSLEAQGIKLNLYAYDAGTDTTMVNRILNLPEVKQMDLVIGPVYKSGATIASRFARTTGIPVINPLSQDLDVAGPNSNVFLFESSVATQARQAATYAYNTFSPKTAVILFENTKDDTTFAYFYKEQFKKLGGKVKTYRKINSAQASATAGTFNNLNLTDDVGHMAVFSDKMTAAVNATSKLQATAATLPLVTYNSWLNINQITLRQLDNLEVYFISPKYLDATSPAVKEFRKKYIQRYNIPPSVYAYAGFEMLYYYSSLLSQYGPNLTQALLENGISRGALYPAVGYTNKTTRVELRSDNQFVPIIKLENLQPIVVNTVY